MRYQGTVLTRSALYNDNNTPEPTPTERTPHMSSGQDRESYTDDQDRESYTVIERPADGDEHQYEVTVSNFFDATTPEDAVAQMAAWLADNAYQAGYRVERTAADGLHTIGTFIDAERIDWNERARQE